MTLALNRLELANIRSHTHVVFEPDSLGLTSISGPNGAGKSTIVDSVAWCLYGTKPQGVSKVISILRNGAELPKDKCFARLDLTVDSRKIRIERRMIKGGSVECEVFEWLPGDDGITEGWQNVAGPTVSHSEPYVRKLLRMDEKGFLAAILIQQKQVDQLISATPRERAAVIEKLTGIASVTAAVIESRQEYNSLRKMASYSTVNENELEELKINAVALHDELHTKTALNNQLVSTEHEAKKAGRELADRVSEESTKADEAQENEKRLAALTALISSKDGELSRLLEEKASRKKKLSNLGAGSTLDELSEKHDGLKVQDKALHEDEFKLKNQILDTEQILTEAAELIALSEFKDVGSAQAGRAKQDSKVTALRASLQASREVLAGLGGKKDSIARAITIIGDGHGSCPTCLQSVADIDNALNALRQEAEDLTAAAAGKAVEIEDLVGQISTSDEIIGKFDQLIDALRAREEFTPKLDALNQKLQNIITARRTLEAELKSFEKIYNQAKAQDELKRDYERVLENAKAVSDELEAMKQEIHTLENRTVRPLTPTALAKLRRELDTSRAQYNSIKTKLVEVRGDINLLKEQLKNLNEKIAQQEEAVVKHKELLKSVEVASNSTQLLEEFRSNRIENSVPLIEAYASDLLSRFTEGKFTRLKLDGKFNASVILADGNERAIGLLSGGELSAASMALRLAVSMLLNGGSSQSLIIMDEVLVSQDAGRAELILNTIKDICKGQVILIAHNDMVHDISDKIVTLA